MTHYLIYKYCGDVKFYVTSGSCGMVDVPVRGGRYIHLTPIKYDSIMIGDRKRCEALKEYLGKRLCIGGFMIETLEEF